MKIAFRLLPYLYLLLSALVCLALASVLISIGTFFQEHPHQARDPRQFATLIILALIGIVLATVYTLNAIFLLRRIKRKTSLILSLISCLGFPFGTILGVFSLVVLTRRQIKGEYA